MSDTGTAPEKGEKGGKPVKSKSGGAGKMLFAILAFLAGAGAGGVGAAIGVSKFNGAGHEAAPKVGAAGEKAAVDYVDIDNAFTSNLADTGRYLQVRISVSTTGGPDVAAAITRHKPALISSVLSVLGELSEIDVANRLAKDKLRARLKAAINDALRAKGQAVGIDEVFFTSLVVQ